MVSLSLFCFISVALFFFWTFEWTETINCSPFVVVICICHIDVTRANFAKYCESAGLPYSGLCFSCICCWSLPAYALEHRRYSHNTGLYWKYRVANGHSSLWRGRFLQRPLFSLVFQCMCVYDFSEYFVFSVLIFLFYVSWFVIRKRGFLFYLGLLFLKGRQLVLWLVWLLRLTQGNSRL